PASVLNFSNASRTTASTCALPGATGLVFCARADKGAVAKVITINTATSVLVWILFLNMTLFLLFLNHVVQGDQYVNVFEKLYLNENWMRKSSDLKPSRKFSRLPHCSSPPIITLSVGEQQVGERVVTAMVCIRCLAVRVIDVHERISGRGAETLAPVVIEKRHHAPHREGDALDRAARISSRSQLDTDIDGRVVHVVLNSLAKHERETAGVVRRKLEVGRYIHAGANCRAAEIKRISGCVNPLHSPEHARDLEITPVARETNVA